MGILVTGEDLRAVVVCIPIPLNEKSCLFRYRCCPVKQATTKEKAIIWKNQNGMATFEMLVLSTKAIFRQSA
jgi:hypothetical protein